MAAVINVPMRSRLAAFCIAAACALPVLAAAETHTVLMEGVVFVPQTLTVKPGDVVVWVNRDLFPHTATDQNREFDSGEIGPDKTWKYTANKPGKFSYVCTLHPTMKGTLVVK